MAFDDTYRESIQTKHIANVGFTSTAKGVTNEAYALKNPHQVLASQIPAVDVVGTYGPLVSAGIGAGLVEKHTIKLTADPTVNNNKAWVATESNCTETGHSARGAIRVDQWMRYAETQYKLRLFEDTGANAPDYTAEILPSETQFNWEYDASAGIIYFDEDPSLNGKTLPLWGELYTYVGASVEDSLGATNSGVGDLTEMFQDTNEPTGFVDRISSALSFDDDTRTLTISGTSYSYYIEGEKYTKTSPESIQITDVEGMHYLYYEGAALTHTTTLSYDLIYNKAYVAAVYWDATNSGSIYVGDERHGVTMDGETHAYLHTSFGTQFVSGLSLSSVDPDEDGSLDAHAQFGVESGYIRDEDILISIATDASPTNIPVLYKTGASGLWRYDAVTNFPVKSYSGGNGYLAYNQFTGGSWQQTEVASAGFVLAHIFATNDVENGIIAIQGQATYTTVSAARLGATEELSTLVLGGLPFVEFAPIATVIYQTGAAFTNSIMAVVRSTDLGADYVDWRFAKLSPIESSVTYHSSLAGLTDAGAHPASSIYTDTTNFDGKLSTADDTVQKALDTLDDHLHDDRYYTEAEIDTTLSGYSLTTHNHDSDYADINHNHDLEYDALGAAGSAVSTHESTYDHSSYATTTDLSTLSGTLQSEIDGKTDIGHTHSESDITDLDKYTQAEVDSLVSSVSGTLTDEIIWEVVDTPTQQIRPKLAHMGKAIYTSGALTIGGDLTVSGTTTTIHSQELTVADKVITVNNGEVGAGITGSPYAGIEVDRGSETNYMFVFDESQDNFRVGISGSLQAVATREDVPNDGYVAVWNESAVRFDTSIALTDLATDAELAAVSGTLQTSINNVASDLANNYYTSVQLDGGQLDNRYYTETEVDILISSISGTLGSDYYTKVELDAGQLDNRYYTETEIDNTLSSYYTSASVDILLSGKSDTGHTHDDRYYTETEIDLLLDGLSSTFIELTDTMSSYNAGRVLFTTASGVVDSSAFTFDSDTGILSVTGINLGTGSYANEIVTTVTSGTTDLQLPTGKAVWDAVAAAAAAVHTHYDVDGVYSTDYVWTYGTGFAEVPSSFVVYVNGMKNRPGAGNDYTVEVSGGIITITFEYKVKSDFWVNITYTA